jgi:hypothetical protein
MLVGLDQWAAGRRERPGQRRWARRNESGEKGEYGQHTARKHCPKEGQHELCITESR